MSIGSSPEPARTTGTYGALSEDLASPLASISVANSSLSIDPWVGCRWQCAYCHVQGSEQDVAEDGALRRSPTRRSPHTIDELVDALVRHPYFHADRTVLSIGTASTEPLTPGPVADSTFAIIDGLIRRGLANPVWIVTKRGLDRRHLPTLEAATAALRGVMLSVSWADNPLSIEPIRTDRFRFAREARQAGASVSWFMRPLSATWSGNPEGIERMMRQVSTQHPGTVEMIVPGALRWSEGIEYSMTRVHGVAFPGARVDGNGKQDLPATLQQAIIELAGQHFPDVPVYFRSSCAITHMLQRSSIGSVQHLDRAGCAASLCPRAQRMTCDSPGATPSVAHAERAATRVGLPLTVIDWQAGSAPETAPPLETINYKDRQAFLNALAP